MAERAPSPAASPASLPAAPKRGLARIFRTTAFKLAAIYLVVFTAFAGFLIAYIAYNTGQILSRQLSSLIDDELDVLRRQYQQGGLRRLINTIEFRARQPGASLYLVTDFSGNSIAGNIADIPNFVFNDPDGRPRPVRYERLGDDEEKQHFAIVRVFQLEGGFRVLVGRDVGERDRFGGVIRDALRIAVLVMIALGLMTWWFVSRHVLKRIDQVADTSNRIVAGDLSQRLPLAGNGDEFDRLSESLNGMLGRIDELMVGLKEVSDNIAHDLKTPLTRLRNRVEGALAGEATVEAYRGALEATIDDADGLIKTFNALLQIARVEAGSAGAAMEAIDLAEVIRDAVELYEPVAEEAGARLTADVAAVLPVDGNRELIAQAIINLIDNALKYGKPSTGEAAIRVGARVEAGRAILEVADNGPGILEADRERALTRFGRLDGARTAPGFGLGLALVAAVARLHGGEVRLGDARPGLSVALSFPARRG